MLNKQSWAQAWTHLFTGETSLFVLLKCVSGYRFSYRCVCMYICVGRSYMLVSVCEGILCELRIFFPVPFLSCLSMQLTTRHGNHWAIKSWLLFLSSIMKRNKKQASDKGESRGNEMNPVIKVHCSVGLLVQSTPFVCARVCTHAHNLLGFQLLFILV